MNSRYFVSASSFRVAVLLTLTSVFANAQQLKVDLPRDTRNAIPDRRAASSSAVLVAIPDANEVYLNGKLEDKNSLGYKLRRLIEGKSDDDRIVYIAAAANVQYGILVDVLNVIREHNDGTIGLIVEANEVSPKIFKIEVPVLRDEDVSKLKVNPLTLMATVSDEKRLTLNHDSGPKRKQLCFDSVPEGLASDPFRLQRWLECLFAHRTKQRAYAIGMETRTDLPLTKRIEKTVFVEAARSLRYVDVVRVIDAVQGAGAHPVGLKIDDLPE
jgi:biopolymer transport protein ExbD